MIARLLGMVAAHAKKSEIAPEQIGLDRDHPLVRFFSDEGATLVNYLALDDAVVMGAVERMTHAADSGISDLAERLRERRLYKTLCLRAAFGHDTGRQHRAARRIDKQFEAQLLSGTVIKDEGAAVSIYTQIGGDDERSHKKLHILDAGQPKEITELSPMVEALSERKQFTRYYFENESDRESARSPRSSAMREPT